MDERVIVPWAKVADLHIGGLTDIGFAHDSDLLLVLSHAGRGLFDCTAGVRLARDSGDYSHDTGNLIAEGIGPLAGTEIRTAGLHGGGLSLVTEDGWSAEMNFSAVPFGQVLLQAPEYWKSEAKSPSTGRFGPFESDLHAFGFSPTGRTFIIALSSGISVYCRTETQEK